MLPWQQSMLEQWDHYSVDQPAALKRKALALSLGIYALIFLLFFIPHLQQSSPVTVFIHGATAPVLFMNNGSGNGSARLKRVQKARKVAAQKKLEQAKKVKAPAPAKPEPKKADLPARKSVIKEPKKKSKKELLAEKQKAQAAALKAKKAEAAKKAAAEKLAREKLAQEKKRKEQKLKEKEKKNDPKVLEKQVPEKNEQKVLEVEHAVEETSSDELQDIMVGQDFGDASGEGYDPALKSHMALGRAITRVWRPPQVKITSQVRVVADIDATGKVNDAQLEKKSGVVAYDIAARAAVLRAEFPKEFWGKKVALVFGA